MFLVRLPLIVLLAMMMDLVAPLAIGETEPFDVYEEALHRSRENAAVRPVGAVRFRRIERRPQITGVQVRRRATVRLRRAIAGRPDRRLPSPIPKNPNSPEDH